MLCDGRVIVSACGRRSRRRRYVMWLAVASAAPAVISPPARGDMYYFNHAGGGDFNSSGDPYISWLDITVPGSVNVPPIGAEAYILRSGTVGVTGVTVNQNAIYSGTGLILLVIDSQNTLSQTSAASVM